MTHDELDQILSQDDGLEPSSGFHSRVMEAVRRDADTPVKPSFPWVRFVFGLVASGAAAGTGADLLSRFDARFAHVSGVLATIAPELGYGIAAALVGLSMASFPFILSRLRS
jgi:hypothetical protein